MQKSDSKKIIAIILTGGEGKRFRENNKSCFPKQFANVHGIPLFIHCINIYKSINEIDELYLVINERWKNEYKKELMKYNIKNINIVAGGKTRLKSVINAVQKISNHSLLVLQNGVNPSTSIKLIKKCIKVAFLKNAVTAYIPSFFTNIIIKKNQLIDTIDRKKLGYTTDPQVYDYELLKKGIDFAFKNKITDMPTVQLIKNIGQKVYLVKSDQNNIKVTLKNDIKALEAVLICKKN